jgi:predicted dehydrogenase
LIVEKPLAQDLASAVELVGAAERNNVVLTVCFPQRYESSALVAKRLVSEGALGVPSGAFTLFLTDKPPSYWLGGYSGRAVTSWRTSRERAGGGVLIMNLSHYLDLVRHLLGLEVESVAALANVVDGPSEVEDTVSLTVGYANGAVGTVLACSAVRGGAGGETRVELWGPLGRIALEPRAAAYSTRAIGGMRASRWYALGGDGANVRARYLSRVATAIHRGEEPDVTARDGLVVQAQLEAAYRSAESGEIVRPADLLREVLA